MTDHASAIRHLRDYVAIPSVNPMGRVDIPSDWIGETRLAEFLYAQIRQLGVDAELVGQGQRQSVIAELRSSDPSAETVLVASHIDTVPVDGMKIDPFDPKIDQDRLYGRGSCDTKAGMASLMAACEQVLERGCLRRNLILVGEADEELGSLGVRDVLAQLETRRPDWVLATEPTGLEVVHAHKGVVHVRLEAAGRACHASDPSAGRNAVVDLARATLALEGLAHSLAEQVHPLLGSATLSVGQFEGGAAPNVVPGHAELIADRRILPGETVEDVAHQIQAALRRAGVEEEVRIVSCQREKPALGTPADHPCVQTCRQALKSASVCDAVGTVAFGTDAGVFEVDAGWPGVVMGPGSIEQAHTNSEYLEIDQVEAMARFFVSLLSGDPLKS